MLWDLEVHAQQRKFPRGESDAACVKGAETVLKRVEEARCARQMKSAWHVRRVPRTWVCSRGGERKAGAEDSLMRGMRTRRGTRRRRGGWHDAAPATLHTPAGTPPPARQVQACMWLRYICTGLLTARKWVPSATWRQRCRIIWHACQTLCMAPDTMQRGHTHPETG